MSKSGTQFRPISLSPAPERRRQPRVHLSVLAHVSRSNSEGDSRLAYMRDANVRGAFFYCDLRVDVGDTLHVRLVSTHAIAGLDVNCEASVVRVEKSDITDLTGVAVEFQRFEVEDPAHACDPATNSLISWTAEKFDRMFARRPELEKCAFRIQGAA
jgi:PilZ domain-containing protein